MNEPSFAVSMLRVGLRDLNALRLFPTQIPDEVFGFFAQQAAEKLLKAWIAALDKDVPFVHDLEQLLNVLRENGIDTASWDEFDELIPFAVQYRYDSLPESFGNLDRTYWLKRLDELYRSVVSVIND